MLEGVECPQTRKPQKHARVHTPLVATLVCLLFQIPTFEFRKKRNNPHQAPKYAQVPMVAVFAFFEALEFGFSGEDYTSQFREIHAIVMFIKF